MNIHFQHNSNKYCGNALLVFMIFLQCAGLYGCTGLAIGAGAAVATSAVEERGVGKAAGDFAIVAAINALWAKHDPSLVIKLDATVSEGRVLLTGTLNSELRRLKAVRLTSKVTGIKSIINEITVSNGRSGVSGYGRDSWITAELIRRLSFDRSIEYINYKVETANKTVYLMGVAQSQVELDRVVNHARQVKYVRRVVSYVLKKEDPQRKKRQSTLHRNDK